MVTALASFPFWENPILQKRTVCEALNVGNSTEYSLSGLDDEKIDSLPNCSLDVFLRK